MKAKTAISLMLFLLVASQVKADLLTGFSMGWSMDDNAANTLIRNLNTSAANLTAGLNTDGVTIAGMHNTALSIHCDSDSNCPTGAPKLGAMTKATISFWFKTPAADSAQGIAFTYFKDDNNRLQNSFKIGGNNLVSSYDCESATCPGEQTTSAPTGQSGWALFVEVINGTHHLFYINGTLRDTKANVVSLDGIGNTNLVIGKYGGASTATNLDMSYDEIYIWSRALSSAEITDLWNLGTGKFWPFTTTAPNAVNWLGYPPATGDTQSNNSRMYFYNLTGGGAEHCAIYNLTGVFWNDTAPKIINKKYNITLTSLTQGKYSLNVRCINGTTSYNSTAKTLTVDTTNPSITLNPSNFFNAASASLSNQYTRTQNLKLNITFSDNYDISAYYVNITCKGISKASWVNISTPVGTTKIILYKAVNATLWPAQTCKTFIQTADRHTKNNIADYRVVSSLNSLQFDTQEQNRIKISSPGAIGAKAEKQPNKYSLEFNYLIPGKSKEFIVECDNQFDYYPESNYFGHFRCWNEATHNGNWLDFEGLNGSISVKFEGKHKAVVTVDAPEISTKVNLKSIGGLNVNNATYYWYRGNYTTSADPIAVVGTLQNFKANLTRNSTLIKNITARFIYNGSIQTLTANRKAGYIDFFGSVNVPRTAGTYNYSWTFYVFQVGNYNYSFAYNGSQAVQFATMNISIWDEENNTVIKDSATIYVSGTVNRQSNTSSGAYLFGDLQLGTYRIEAETPSYPRRGYWYKVINGSNQPRIYLVKDRTGNDYIDYYFITSGQDPIENVTASYYKTFNQTERIMASYRSDYAGQIQIFQDQQQQYRITLNSSYPYKAINLMPIKTSYTISLLTSSENIYNNVYEGLRMQIIPQERILNRSGKWYNVTFSVLADDMSLQYFGILLDNHSFTCKPANCLYNFSSDSNGGRAFVGLRLNKTGTFNMHFFIKRSGFPLQYVNGRLEGVTLIEGLTGKNVAQWFSTLKGNVGSPTMAAVLAAILIVGLILTGAQMGIAGAGLTIIAVIGTIFFTLLNYIPKTVGFAVVIVGIMAYIFVSNE